MSTLALGCEVCACEPAGPKVYEKMMKHVKGKLEQAEADGT